jgi:hypothetical protein
MPVVSVCQYPAFISNFGGTVFRSERLVCACTFCIDVFVVWLFRTRECLTCVRVSLPCGAVCNKAHIIVPSSGKCSKRMPSVALYSLMNVDTTSDRVPSTSSLQAYRTQRRLCDALMFLFNVCSQLMTGVLNFSALAEPYSSFCRLTLHLQVIILIFTMQVVCLRVSISDSANETYYDPAHSGVLSVCV